MALDSFTVNHLNTWLDNAVLYRPAIDEVRTAMIAFVEENPEGLDEGWPWVYSRVDGLTIEQAIERVDMLHDMNPPLIDSETGQEMF